MPSQLEDALVRGVQYEIPPNETIVLIIDDELLILNTLQKALGRQGYVVLIAESAELGLDILASDLSPQVVLTDKNLPGMDGLDLILKGKSLSPYAEFIVMTGYASVESSIRAIELGAAGFLQKPFDLEVMIRQVKSAVTKHAAVVQNQHLVERLQTLTETTGALRTERDVLKSFVEENLCPLLERMKTGFDSEKDPKATVEEASRALDDFMASHRGLLHLESET